MTAIQRLRTTLSGFIGGPGVSTMYFVDAAASVAAVRAFWNSFASSMPQDVTIQVEAQGDIIEDSTGAITGGWTGSPVTAVVGGISSGYSAPVGTSVRWNTGAVVGGRRLHGRTFVVPLGGNSFDTAGLANQGGVDIWKGYATTLIAAAPLNMLVWGRPRVQTVPYTDGRGIPHKGLLARAGVSAIVTDANVGRKAAVLRSRRD